MQIFLSCGGHLCTIFSSKTVCVLLLLSTLPHHGAFLVAYSGGTHTLCYILPFIPLPKINGYLVVPSTTSISELLFLLLEPRASTLVKCYNFLCHDHKVGHFLLFSVFLIEIVYLVKPPMSQYPVIRPKVYGFHISHFPLYFNKLRASHIPRHVYDGVCPILVFMNP